MTQKIKDIIDISVPLKPDMPIWPGSAGLKLRNTMSLETGDHAHVTHLDLDVHTGTHVDAPRHFIKDGSTVDQLPLGNLIGLAAVAYLPKANVITVSDLDALTLPADTKRLLLRTCNSDLWASGVKEFRKDYVALTADAARWVVAQEIRLIGVDYLSVQRYGDSPLTHRILLEAGVIVVEGLNLADVQPGAYELICLPLKLVGTEGAPARAVLRNVSAMGCTQEAGGRS